MTFSNAVSCDEKKKSLGMKFDKVSQKSKHTASHKLKRSNLKRHCMNWKTLTNSSLFKTLLLSHSMCLEAVSSSSKRVKSNALPYPSTKWKWGTLGRVCLGVWITTKSKTTFFQSLLFERHLRIISQWKQFQNNCKT